MEITFTDEKLKEIAEQEIRKEIRQRVQKVLDGGMGFWFTEQNIKSLTRECVSSMINQNITNHALTTISKAEIMKAITDGCVNVVAHFFEERY